MGRKRSAGLTPRQREWLGHLRKAARAGEAVRAYAKRLGLSEHAMYQAAKDLRRQGVLPPTGRAPKRRPVLPPATAPRARFVELRATQPAPEEAPGGWRARFPNGVVIEGVGALGSVFEALGRLG